MPTERHYKPASAPEFRIAVEENEGRAFIAVGGLQIDIHMAEDGAVVQLQHRNEVLDEASADYPEAVERNGHGV